MDFNVVVQGKMFFINQSGVLSNTQTLESDKIKTIKSTFPNALASFFNFGNIDILTEGDQGSLGAMQMFYVTSPAKVVNSIQTLLGEKRSMTPKQREELEKKTSKTCCGSSIGKFHTTNDKSTKNRRSIKSYSRYSWKGTRYFIKSPIKNGFFEKFLKNHQNILVVFI